ncbi:DUF3237 domain-containing protein [Sphingorhabdus sp. SMR4y]|uniref:DUF3237 domain-containing protein n=1 Tax=Sphingorhabdus sp. SMR4y TaxID=2584094 RepID=UPI000B5CD216|nr:DUF3237 domain-containing protein [Sphingorhabdus sp. SMR4y]ASK90066.1 hypothetical protein SPHFLASMR4Y_03340 [Sphingorhabdus sp. SMR4y]
MTELKHRHLMNMTLSVDFSGMMVIGQTPAGLRRIAPVTGGSFSGERLTGTVLPGADWVINRPDGVMEIDVRLPLETDDGAMIYLNYQGRFLATPETMARMAKGALLEPEDYSLAVTATFETGAEQYLWLNNVVAAGTGEQTADGPVYSFFEIG